MNSAQPPEEPVQNSPERNPGQPADREPLYQVIFISPGTDRLRAGWRLLIQLVLLIILLFGLRYAVGYFLAPRVPFVAANPFYTTQLAMLIAVTFSVFFSRVVLDQRDLSSLGLKVSWTSGKQLLYGLLVGGSVMGMVYLMEWAFGWLKFSGFAWESRPTGDLLLEAAVFLVVFGGVAWQEELLFRGYWFWNLREGLNTAWAAGITSALFAAAHWGNPQFSLLPLAGLFLAGMLIAYSALVSRSLWMPIGLHLGWNLIGGLILGYPVSGLQVPSLVQQQLTGPEVWTGGSFGPEAGLILVPSLLLGAFLLWSYRVYSDLDE